MSDISTAVEISTTSIMPRDIKLEHLSRLQKDMGRRERIEGDIKNYEKELVKLNRVGGGIIQQRNRDRLEKELELLKKTRQKLIEDIATLSNTLDKNVPGFHQHMTQQLDLAYERGSIPIEDRPGLLENSYLQYLPDDTSGLFKNIKDSWSDRAASPHLVSPVGGPPFEHRTSSEIEHTARLREKRMFEDEREKRNVADALMRLNPEWDRRNIIPPRRKNRKIEREAESGAGGISALTQFGLLLKKMGPKGGNIKRQITAFANKRKNWQVRIVNKMYNMYLRNNV